MEAFREKLSTTGIAVRYQKDNSNQKKGILRLESAAGADGPVETLILNQAIENRTSRKKRLVEVEQSRMNLKDVMGAFGSEGSMSGLNQAMKEKATVLLAATRSKRNRRIILAPLRFTIDDDTLSFTRAEIMSFLCGQRDTANGVLTNILPTEGVAMAGSTITFFSDNFAEDGMVGTLTKIDLIMQVSDQLFEIGKWAGVVAPVFAVFASLVAGYEKMQGLKSDFIDLLERLSKVEGSLPDERRLKSDMLGLAEDFFFMSGLRKHFASKDFEGDLTRLMGRMDRAVQGQTLRHAVETTAKVAANGAMLKAMDSKINKVLDQTAPDVHEKKFDWMSVKSMLPQSRLFMGRKDELRKIREHVEKLRTITALVGVAGCGKSHLAREAADQWSKGAPKGEHRIVLFASVANEESYTSDLRRIMKTLGLEPVLQEGGKPIPTAELSRRIHQRLGEAPPYIEVLWILDNAPVSADGPDLLKAWFGPEEDRCWGNLRVLLTSQSKEFSFKTSFGEIEMLQVNPLPTDVSLALLTKGFPNVCKDADEVSAATELVSEYLHNLPVAILPVASLIFKRSWTIRRYLKRHEEKRVTKGVDSVREVLQDALAEARRDPSLTRVLDVAAFVSPDNIPLSLLGNDEELVEQLCRINLLQMVIDEHYSMHGLIQAAARIDRSPRDAIIALEDALEPYQDKSHETWQAAVAVLPHFEALHRVASVECVLVELPIDDLKVYGWLLNNCGRVYFTVLCKLEQSRILYEESLTLRRAAYGVTANHTAIASTLHNLGMVYRHLGEYEQAKDSFGQALAMKRAVHGAASNRSDIAGILNNLGSVYRQLGEYEQAKDSYEQALAMKRAVYGAASNHADIALTLNSLGLVCQHLGEYDRAEDHYKQALAMCRAVYGVTANHTDIAGILNNLGSVYRHLGKYEQAKGSFDQALAMKRAVYGAASNHADISLTLNSLGLVYQHLGEYDRAEDYYKKALAMCRAVYGVTANHTDIAEILNNLGSVYRHLGKYEQAKDSFGQALAMKRAVYGVTANHADISLTLNSLGLVCQHLGEYDRAEDYYKQALAMCRAVYGVTANHTEIAGILNNLGSVYRHLGRYEQAKDSFGQALAMKRAVYGVMVNHTDIALTLNNLGEVCQHLGEYDRAKDYYKKALAMCRAVYGVTANHTDIAAILNNLGEVYRHLGKYDRAKDYYEQALAMKQAVYGAASNHADIALTLNNLGLVYQHLGEYDRAKDYYEQALAMGRAVYGVTANHTDVALTLNNLGSVCRCLGDYERAKDYYEQALNMFRTVYQGNESHTRIQICLSNLQELSQVALQSL